VRELELLAAPERGNARMLRFFRLALSAPGRVCVSTNDQEHVADVLSGTCRIRVAQRDRTVLDLAQVGNRSSIFCGLPEMVYVPRESRYQIEWVGGQLEVAIYAAPALGDSEALHVLPEMIRVSESGRGDWLRTVYLGLGEDSPATNIMVGETASPPGNWSSFPPHRHMADNPPMEQDYEELYYMRFEPSSGFAIGGIYADHARRADTCNLRLVHDGQVFDVPSGYHLIAPCPGYRLRYTWALGGRGKRFGAWLVDPDLAWLDET